MYKVSVSWPHIKYIHTDYNKSKISRFTLTYIWLLQSLEAAIFNHI